MKGIGKAMVVVLALSLVGFLPVGISNFSSPTVLAAELESVHMDVKGMTCGACAAKVKSSLTKLPEVKETNISVEKGSVDVKVDKGSDHKALVKAVEGAGFTVKSVECECKG